MIAICPAGPPKLMKPSLSQKRKASAKLTGPGRSVGVDIDMGLVEMRGGQLRAPPRRPHRRSSARRPAHTTVRFG